MRFSIIIPTCNRPKLLAQCLTAIQGLNYPRDRFEVLVVDDGSDSPPVEVVVAHESQLSLRYYQYQKQGPARVRNRALRQARGEYVVFIDDDCVPDREWLNALDQAFILRPEAGLGGKINDAPENSIFGMTSQLLITYLYGYSEATGRLRFFCSNNLAFPRQILIDKTAGFEEAFPLAAAEDRDLCDRWLKQGELHYVAGAIVQHRQDLNFDKFLAQHYRYGRGAFQFWSLRQAKNRAGVNIEPWSFYVGMLTFPYTTAPVRQAVPMSLLLVLSQMATAAGYYSEQWRQ